MINNKVAAAVGISCLFIRFDERPQDKLSKAAIIFSSGWSFSALCSFRIWTYTRTDFLSLWFSRLRAAILTKVIFKRRFLLRWRREKRKQRPQLNPPPPFVFEGMEGGGDLQLELHNGCLFEFIKQMMFHPLPVGKHGHKRRLHVF